MTIRRACLMVLTVLVAVVALPGSASAEQERSCSLKGTLTTDVQDGSGPDDFIVGARLTAGDGSEHLSGEYLRLYQVNGRLIERNGKRLEDTGKVSGDASSGTWTLEVRYLEGATGGSGVLRVTGQGALERNRLTIRGTYEVIEGHKDTGKFLMKGSCKKLK